MSEQTSEQEQQQQQEYELQEDVIYSIMYEQITEELSQADGTGQDTPNLAALEFTKEQIETIRRQGIQAFKEILQLRFRKEISNEDALKSNKDQGDNQGQHDIVNTRLEGVPQSQSQKVKAETIQHNTLGVQKQHDFTKDLTNFQNILNLQDKSNDGTDQKGRTEQNKPCEVALKQTDLRQQQDSLEMAGHNIHNELKDTNRKYEQNMLIPSSESKRTDVFGINGVVVSSYKSINDPSSNNNNNNNTTGGQSSLLSSRMSYLSRKSNRITALNEDEDKQNQQLDTHYQAKPIPVSRQSQKILKSIGYLPPQQKACEDQKQKMEKRQKLQAEKQAKRQEDELQGCTFHPKILEHNSKGSRSVGAFLLQQNLWLEHKNDNILNSQQEAQERELIGSTFTPRINNIPLNRPKDIPIEEKLVRDLEKTLEKRKLLIEQSRPSFQPTILQKSKSMVEKQQLLHSSTLTNLLSQRSQEQSKSQHSTGRGGGGGEEKERK